MNDEEYADSLSFVSLAVAWVAAVALLGFCIGYIVGSAA
jgi:hypothetical protein